MWIFCDESSFSPVDTYVSGLDSGLADVNGKNFSHFCS